MSEKSLSPDLDKKTSSQGPQKSLTDPAGYWLSYKSIANRYIIWKTGRSDLSRYELRQLRKPITSTLLMTIGLIGSVMVVMLLMLARR